MANPPIRAQARLFAQLIADLSPEVRRGFMASVTDLNANVDFNTLLDRLTAGDINGAIDALNISPAAWAEYSSAMTSVYAQAGAATAAQLREYNVVRVGARFDIRNPRAEEWIRRNVADRVTGFTNEQIGSARNLIERGYANGAHPRQIATDMVGRSVGGGRRSGGIMGMDSQRAARYETVVEAMRTPQGVQDIVITHRDGTRSIRYKVNKSTANRILAAHAKQEAVPAAQREISERQLNNALLLERGDTVAQTETGNAVLSARDEEWQQATEGQGIDPARIRKTWYHRRGRSRFHRPDHLAMSGNSVIGLETPFVFGSVRMQHAHDPNGGPEHTIRCGCDTTYQVIEDVQ